MKGNLRVRHFRAERLLPSCLHCHKPVSLDGQNQGWLHNECVAYPMSDREVAFRAEQARRRGIAA